MNLTSFAKFAVGLITGSLKGFHLKKLNGNLDSGWKQSFWIDSLSMKPANNFFIVEFWKKDASVLSDGHTDCKHYQMNAD